MSQAAAGAADAKIEDEQTREGEDVECALLLRLENVDVFIVRGQKKIPISSGVLQVLVSQVEGDEHVLITVGDAFQYALEKKLPCMKVADRNYILPSAKDFFGIVLPSDVAPEEIDVFEMFLQDYSFYRVKKYVDQSGAIENMEETIDEDRVAVYTQNVAKYVAIGGVKLAAGIKIAADYGGKGIEKSGAYVTKKIAPNDAPTKVSDKTKSRIKKARFVSKAAVSVSKAIVVGAITAAGVMSTGLANAAAETDYGKKIQDSSSQRAEAAKELAKSTVGAALNVVGAAEDAAVKILKDTADATTTVLTHKYGDEVGESSKDAMGVVSDLGEARIGMRKVGARALATRTVAGAGVELISSEEENAVRKQGQPSIDPMTGMSAMMVASQLAQQHDDKRGGPQIEEIKDDSAGK